MNRARRALIALGLAVVLLPSACLSPTLPLPPPGRPDTIEGPDQNGYVRLTGVVPPLAVANAWNLTTQKGANHRTQEDGRYDLVFGALAGDEILLWYNLDRENSPAIRFEIPAPTP